MSRAVSVITVLVVLMVAGAVMADEEASLEAMNRPPSFVASSVILKAPIHTCVIKYYPGLKEFVQKRVPEYNTAKLQVQAFSQPPNFNFYSEADEAYEQVAVPGDATAAQVEEMLSRWGITAGSGAQTPTQVNECEADL